MGWTRLSVCSLLVAIASASACAGADAPAQTHHEPVQESAGAHAPQTTPAMSAAPPAADGGMPERAMMPEQGGMPAAAEPAAGHGGGGQAAPHAEMAGGAGTADRPIMASAGAGGAAAADGPEPASCHRTSADSSTPTVYVIGDSTASIYTSDLYPRTGWAQPLQAYFQPACAKVEDKALSGRSSKSFFEEGSWTPIKSQLRAGDFVLIQFGHNDEKQDDAERYTEPFGSYQQYLSKYIDDALAAKATPILLTPIERNNWSSGKLKSTHGDYPQAMRALGEMRKLTVVDMTQLTHAYFEGLGQAATTKLFMNLSAGESPNYPNGNSDNTHLQEKGARAVADIAMAELAHQRTPVAALLDHVPKP